MPKVNPDILRWARETAGLSLEEGIRKLGINDLEGQPAIDRLISLESGNNIPTRAMLVKMSKQYHRPLVIFYMSQPPRKGNRGNDFRTLPKDFSRETNALVDALIRDIQVRQSIIREGLEGDEESVRLLFVKSMNIRDGITALVESIKGTIQFDLKEFRKKPSPIDAYSYLRRCAESVGIFVLMAGDLGSHHTDIGVEAFRGFAIADDMAPFVVINDNDSKAAWSFTLMHELAHIWLGQTGVDNTNYENVIEQFCNDVASELLLPKDELIHFKFISKEDLETATTRISEFAEKRNISNSMVAYKLYKMDYLGKETWLQLSQSYHTLWLMNKNIQRFESREKSGGPNFYTVRRFLIGPNLMATVQRMVAGGTITTTKAGKILGVKVKNVQKLLESNGTPTEKRLT